MKPILITGISGFVGGHFSHYLTQKRRDFIIHGISRSKPNWNFVPDDVREKVIFHQADLLDMKKTNQILQEIKPDYIVHLASFSSVANSWKQPVECFLNNTNIFLNIIESVRLNNIDCKILSVGSSEEYGIVEKKDLPLREECRIMPANPYAVARVSQENLALIYSKGYRLNICCTRSFNHIGPGQSARFVISSIVKQFAEIKSKKKAPVIHIGNGSIVRDFCDVRDVVAAYDALLEKGTPGEIYNICSGKGYSITDIIKSISDIYGIDVKVEQEYDLLRPLDNPSIIGSYNKIEKEIGWRPSINFEDSIRKIFEYWSNQIIMKG